MPDPRPTNLVALVARSVERQADKIAVRWKGPAADGHGHWLGWTYAELWERVRTLSIALGQMGVRAGDRVVILSRSRPEWAVADLAVLALGAVTCPVYHGESARRIGEIIASVGARLVFLEDEAHAEAVGSMDERTRPSQVITFGNMPASPGARRFDDLLLAEGGDPDPTVAEAWRETWQAIPRDALATIVHTVDERGQPLGAMLSHGNLLHNYDALLAALPLSSDEVVLSALPLSHMLERAAGLYVPLGLGATVAYAEHGAHHWVRNMAEIRPTVLVGVPFFFEVLRSGLEAEMAGLSIWQRRLVDLALRAGAARHRNLVAGRRNGPLLTMALLATRRLVERRIKARFGGRLRFFASGGAALRPATGEFFDALGIPIVEGYGLSETSPLLTLNRLERPIYGRVGYPVLGTELRIDPANGEILARGPQVMLGYLDRPAETSQVIGRDGWFHTGDCGRLDEGGALQITGRLKDLIVLTTGKKVSPRSIEAALRSSPLIDDALLLGEGQPSTSLLVAPHRAAVPAGGAALDDAQLMELVEPEVRRVVAELAPYERPRQVGLLSAERVPGQRGRSEASAERSRPGRRFVDPGG
jgi:long-chain acyl-CoA synthetase